MIKNSLRIGGVLPALAGIALVGIASGRRPLGPSDVTLTGAAFDGLTRIAVTASVPLTGLDAAHVVITKSDRTVVPPNLD